MVLVAFVGLALLLLDRVGGVAFAFTAMAGCFASELAFRALALPREPGTDSRDGTPMPPL
jgi:hypothetical protein